MYCKIILVGSLGQDPSLKFTQSGDPVCSFSVATSRKYTNKAGEKVDETLWFRVTAWGKQAEVCQQYLKKGSKVLVEGELKGDPQTGGPRVYEKSDGSHGASFELTAREVRFLSSKENDTKPEETGEDLI
jgi:single-strand DNA-binding protein